MWSLLDMEKLITLTKWPREERAIFLLWWSNYGKPLWGEGCRKLQETLLIDKKIRWIANWKAWNISWNIFTVTGLSDPKYLTDPTRLISTRTKVSDGYVKQWYNANSKGCGGLWNWFEVSRTTGKNLHWKIQRYNIRTRDRKYFLLEIPGFA